MGSISHYIFRTTFGAFLLVLISLTALIWVTQALRDIDLMTSQGQTILVFVGITGLIVPLLVLVIAPIALLIAAAHTLNKLSTDSEIIVMNAAGMSPWFLFRAFMSVAIVVSILVMAISAYFAPKGLRMLRDWLTEVRANVVSTIVQPGRFTPIQVGVTIHIRERQRNGLLVGIFLDDQRNPNERITVMSESGELLDNDNGTFLVLQKGLIQRQETGKDEPAIVVFDRYAFDLAQFSSGTQAVKYSIRERYLWQLMFPDPKDQFYIEQPGQFRAELHDRLVAPLYPLAPENAANHITSWANDYYAAYRDEIGHKPFVMGGDSAGGGLTAALAQMARDAAQPLPAALLLICPWLNLDPAHPDQLKTEPRDGILTISGISEGGTLYAGDLPRTDPRCSPIFGNWDGLPSILAFAGGDDILVTDSRALKAKLPSVEVTELSGMMHDWPIFSFSESRKAQAQMANFVAQAVT